MNELNTDITIDTSNLLEECSYLKRRSEELESEINEYFKIISNINNDNYWTGQTSKTFIRLTMNDKQEYIDYCNSLKRLFDNLENYTKGFEEKVNNFENKTQNDEKKEIW